MSKSKISALPGQTIMDVGEPTIHKQPFPKKKAAKKQPKKGAKWSDFSREQQDTLLNIVNTASFAAGQVLKEQFDIPKKDRTVFAQIGMYVTGPLANDDVPPLALRDAGKRALRKAAGEVVEFQYKGETYKIHFISRPKKEKK